MENKTELAAEMNVREFPFLTEANGMPDRHPDGGEGYFRRDRKNPESVAPSRFVVVATGLEPVTPSM